MSVDQPQPGESDAQDRAQGIDIVAIEAESANATWGDRGGVPELYVKSPLVARFGAALLVVFVAIGTVRWASVASSLFRPQGVVCAGCAADWFRWAQLILAVVGIAAAVAVIAYLAFFASSGRIWRRWPKVAMTFGILAASWTALWWIVNLFPAGR